jgi:hypothetical protein
MSMEGLLRGRYLKEPRHSGRHMVVVSQFYANGNDALVYHPRRIPAGLTACDCRRVLCPDSTSLEITTRSGAIAATAVPKVPLRNVSDLLLFAAGFPQAFGLNLLGELAWWRPRSEFPKHLYFDRRLTIRSHEAWA